MKHKVLLSITGKQSYYDQEPEVMELVTEGTMEFTNGGWDISYQESDLTGLQGVQRGMKEAIGSFPGNIVFPGSVIHHQ